MKPKLFSLWLTAIMMLASQSLFAYDFESGGIYYNITSYSDRTVGVTYKNSNKNSYSGTVTIPESVTYLGITYNVTSIGWTAFEDCSGLTSITIPNSVNKIDSNAFWNCSGLTSITIPNSVTEIGGFAFYSCKSLTDVSFSKGLTNIGVDAFSFCINLTDITIPNGVTSIGNSAFSYCDALTSITIPNSVTSIGEDAFNDCKNINKVNISCKDEADFAAYISRTDICSNFHIEGLLGKSHNILIARKKSTSITIPEGVTSIGEYAFRDCSGLTSITIPNSVTSIGSNAFSG